MYTIIDERHDREEAAKRKSRATICTCGRARVYRGGGAVCPVSGVSIYSKYRCTAGPVSSQTESPSNEAASVTEVVATDRDEKAVSPSGTRRLDESVAVEEPSVVAALPAEPVVESPKKRSDFVDRLTARYAGTGFGKMPG